MTAIRTYLRDDHEITLFAKILKNECDEEFRFVQIHVRNTLLASLKQVLRERWPRKSQAEIASDLEKIRNGFIEGWQWRKILQRMYDKTDETKLRAHFASLIASRKDRAPSLGAYMYRRAQTAETMAKEVAAKRANSQSKMVEEPRRSRSRQRPTRRDVARA